MARIACDLADILTAARQALVTAAVVTDAAAFLAVDAETVPPGPAEPPLAAVTFDSGDRLLSTLSVEEVGNDSVQTEMELHVVLWTRVAIDQAGQDDSALTDTALGLAALMRQTVSALNARDLTSGSDTLTWRSVTWLGFQNRGRYKPDPNWRSVVMKFNVAWNWKLTSS